MFEYFFLIIWHVGKPKKPKKGTLKILPENLNPPPGSPLCTEKIVWNTTFYNLDVYNIHQNLAKQYNDRTDLIVNIILLSIGK